MIVSKENAGVLTMSSEKPKVDTDLLEKAIAFFIRSVVGNLKAILVNRCAEERNLGNAQLGGCCIIITLFHYSVACNRCNKGEF